MLARNNRKKNSLCPPERLQVNANVSTTEDTPKDLRRAHAKIKQDFSSLLRSKLEESTYLASSKYTGFNQDIISNERELTNCSFDVPLTAYTH